MPCNGVKSSKKLVLCYNFCLSQRVKESRFASVGISNDGNDGNSLVGTLLTMKQTLLTNVLNILAQVGDTATNTAAIHFQFCLAGTAHPDSSSYPCRACAARTSCLLGKSRSSTGQARQTIFQLGQFDLQATFTRTRMLTKDIQYKGGTINDTGVKYFLEVALLRWGEFVVENHQVDRQLLLYLAQFLRASLANVGRHIGMMEPLYHCSYDVCSGGRCQYFQLTEGIFNTPQALQRVAFDGDEEGVFMPSISACFDSTFLLCRLYVPPPMFAYHPLAMLVIVCIQNVFCTLCHYL